MSGHSEWFDQFDERQKKQIEFAILYAEQFHHGADGHNSMMIIAKLVDLLDSTYISPNVNADETKPIDAT